MKTVKKLLSLIIVLALCLGVFCACANKGETPATSAPTQTTSAPTEAEEKVTFVFAVTDKDGKTVEHEITTSEKFLADALIEQGILKADEKESGIYTSIDGMVAYWDDGNAWWKIVKDGEMTNDGMNELPIANGDRYEAIYTRGY